MATALCATLACRSSVDAARRNIVSERLALFFLPKHQNLPSASERRFTFAARSGRAREGPASKRRSKILPPKTRLGFGLAGRDWTIGGYFLGIASATTASRVSLGFLLKASIESTARGDHVASFRRDSVWRRVAFMSERRDFRRPVLLDGFFFSSPAEKIISRSQEIWLENCDGVRSG